MVQKNERAIDHEAPGSRHGSGARTAAPIAPVAVGAAAERIAMARDSFLHDEEPPPGLVRAPILASWTRSRQFSVPSDHLELPFESDSGKLLVIQDEVTP